MLDHKHDPIQEILPVGDNIWSLFRRSKSAKHSFPPVKVGDLALLFGDRAEDNDDTSLDFFWLCKIVEIRTKTFRVQWLVHNGNSNWKIITDEKTFQRNVVPTI